MSLAAREQEVGQRIGHLAIGQFEGVAVVGAQMAFDGPRARQVARGAGGEVACQFGDAAVERGELQVKLARGQRKHGGRNEQRARASGGSSSRLQAS